LHDCTSKTGIVRRSDCTSHHQNNLHSQKADKIIFIDREPDLMIADYEDGKLFVDKYMKSKIMQKNFLPETLTKYREASLKYLEQYGDKVEVVFRSGEGKELKDEEKED
ncbi:MAG: hypothetical protein IJ883_02750, partial [Eubacterium sp.]|nr:hypothetical protein [Eubacterium sp.]